jgi:hypothetical protein
VVLFPGLCVAPTVLAVNILGNGLRDMLDPRIARGVLRAQPGGKLLFASRPGSDHAEAIVLRGAARRLPDLAHGADELRSRLLTHSRALRIMIPSHLGR